MSEPTRNANSGSISIVEQEAIDRLCDEFETAWKSPTKPSLPEYLNRISPAARQAAFRELLYIEIEVLRSFGERPLAAHYRYTYPDYAWQVDEVIAALGSSANGDDADPQATAQYSPNNRQADVEFDRDHTIAHEPSRPGGAAKTDRASSRKDSRGLHIRCPHCNNAVELLADTPYEEVSCNTCGSMFSLISREEATRQATPLKTIDRFDLVSRLGVGGFGTVWKARDRELDRVVALKIPRRGQLSHAEIEQFFREARSAAQLRHPNIVPVHEVGREDDTLFIVSDFIRGVALSDWMTANRPSPREVVELCLPITAALQHAHQNGVIHRDLKPSNIMIDEAGIPYLMDFGLAKREVGEITMTVDGQIVGTPRYMSPEQARGEGHWTDRRTDIYSLGVMLFELLTGEGPFRGNAQMQIQQRLTDDPPDPRKLNRHIPRDLSTICLKCLERDPSRRFDSAGELRDEFQRFLRGEPIRSRPLSAPARLARWTKRKPLVAATGLLTIVLAVAGPTAALLIERQRERLVELVGEKNNLIKEYADETRQAASQITKLTKQLDSWEGKANPWEFWPPRPSTSPRQQIMTELFDKLKIKLPEQLAAGTSSDEARGRGYLALAIIADETGRKQEAAAYYGQAHDVLSKLVAKRPSDPRFARALADVEINLARLESDADRDAAAGRLQHAREMLAQAAAGDNRSAIETSSLLETELLSATLAGFEAGQESLGRAAALSNTLRAIYPSGPDEIYELACYLSERVPLMATSKAPSD